MKSAPENPASNKLPAGVSDEQVHVAISKSGYPLQTIVSTHLRPNFHVQEEWSYIDSESLRTIDILATRDLYNARGSSYRIRPTLNLLIECKQSDLPYVFFLSDNKAMSRQFPLIAGLSHDEITLKTDETKSTYTLSILAALDMWKHPFISKAAVHSATLSKCVRKGSELELSGSDPFNSLVIPILKAMQHFKRAESPPKTARYFDCHIAFGIGVLDAPMIGVRITEKGEESLLTPWIRLMRHESYESEDWTKRSTLYVVEILHKDYFPQYVNEHLLPFAEEFSALALKHHEEIASGRGFASGLGERFPDDFEKRIQPEK
jgi:hypothetical protein